MAITYTTETQFNVQISTDSYTMNYWVLATGRTTQTAQQVSTGAYQQLLADSPTYLTYGSRTVYRKNVSVQVTQQIGKYFGSVSYSFDSAVANSQSADSILDSGGLVISLNISATETLGYTFPVVSASTDIPTDHRGTKKDGISFMEPATTLSVKKRYYSLSSGWATTLGDKVGKINNASLFGAAIGSLLYTGCQSEFTAQSGSLSAYVDITHTYQYKSGKASQTLGSLTIPAFKGWEYLDVITRETKVRAAGVVGNVILVNRPVAYQILKIYEQAAIAP